MTAPHEQKLRVTGPVVVTANRLADGAVVYRTQTGRWSTGLKSAAVVTTAAEATRLLKDAAEDITLAVGAYVAPVKVDGGRVAPGNLREVIRSRGPTIRIPVLEPV